MHDVTQRVAVVLSSKYKILCLWQSETQTLSGPAFVYPVQVLQEATQAPAAVPYIHA